MTRLRCWVLAGDALAIARGRCQVSAGTRVTATIYGSTKHGTVMHNSRTAIRWVLWDDGRISWMHLESLSHERRAT